MLRMLGFTLLEVVISLLIIAIMLLGFDAMQLHALRERKAAYYAQVATQQLNNMIARMQLNKNADFSQQLEIWNQQNKKILPKGEGSVNGVYPHYVIKIFWGNGNHNDCENNTVGLSGCLHTNINI